MRTRTSRRLLAAFFVVFAAVATACADDSPVAPAGPSGVESTVAVQPDKQDAGHRRLNQLVGDWDGAKETYVAGGTPEQPAKRQIVSHWRWVAETGNNFLQEVAEDNAADNPYFRQGVLGYSPIDDRYEWTTVDSITPLTMMYKGAKGSGGAAAIEMAGEFTDPGVLGPEFVGKSIPMRTVITMTSAERVTMEIFFAAPGAPERLADRVVLTPRK